MLRDELQSRDSEINARYADQIEAATKMAKRLAESGPDPSVPAKIILDALQNKTRRHARWSAERPNSWRRWSGCCLFAPFIGSPEHDDAEHRSAAGHCRGVHRAVTDLSRYCW